MTRTTASRPRNELSRTDCVCQQPRCAMSGPCLDAALSDDRFGLWARRRRPALRLAS